MEKVLNILLADDQIIVRNGIRFMLNNQDSFISKLTEVEDGSEVMAEVAINSFDIILLDVQMPRQDGINTLRKLREKGVKTPVLVLSAFGDIGIIRQVVENKANGFILKSCGMEELVKAILTVRDGSEYYSNEVALALLGKKKSSGHSIGLEQQLTRREFEIMKLIAEENSYEEIANILHVSRRTIEGHRQKLKSKLQVKSNIGIARFAYQNGHIN